MATGRQWRRFGSKSACKIHISALEGPMGMVDSLKNREKNSLQNRRLAGPKRPIIREFIQGKLA